MTNSFLFYDLDTSGINPRTARIMQFAGQRTDMSMKPIGEPFNILIKLNPDVLPEPDAIVLTGITPQQTLDQGITEVEFLKIFYKDIAQPGTVFVGYNNIRFDDEFIRFLNYRNFHDAYGWHWKNSSSRWDILDLVRMTRALRPDGINWPFSSEGKPSNKLEFLTKTNKLDHDHAHDALSDVLATIAVADLIKQKQPDLFDYAFKNKDKKAVAALVEADKPFVYTSSHYSSEFLHTTAVTMLAKSSGEDSALLYDLRYDPSPFIEMTVDQIADAWTFSRDPKKIRLPVKSLKYNRCPAIAPLGVIKDEPVQERIKLSLSDVAKNLKILNANRSVLAEKVLKAVDKLNQDRKKSSVELIGDPVDVDSQLYDNFISSSDQDVMAKITVSEPDKLSSFEDSLGDERLKTLLPLYQARNFPSSLNEEQRKEWDKFLHNKLMVGGQKSLAAKYFNRLAELAETKTDNKSRYILEELQLYGQSLIANEEFYDEAD